MKPLIYFAHLHSALRWAQQQTFLGSRSSSSRLITRVRTALKPGHKSPSPPPFQAHFFVRRWPQSFAVIAALHEGRIEFA